MSYTGYYRSLRRQWQNLDAFQSKYLRHYSSTHHKPYHRDGDGCIRSPAGIVLTEGQAIAHDLINTDYLLYETICAYWDLFARVRLVTDDKLLTFASRSLLEIYERRICFLAYAPQATVRKRVTKYMFIGAHLWQDTVYFAKKLIDQLQSENPHLRELSGELTSLVAQEKLKDVTSRMGFSDRNYVRSGDYINKSTIDQRDNLYALYSLAVHGDPFAASALEYHANQPWHFLLPKSFQIMLSCEAAKVMTESLSDVDCEDCQSLRIEFENVGRRIKRVIGQNEQLLQPKDNDIY